MKLEHYRLPDPPPALRDRILAAATQEARPVFSWRPVALAAGLLVAVWSSLLLLTAGYQLPQASPRVPLELALEQSSLDLPAWDADLPSR